MVKGLLAGAGVFLAGLVLGVVLLGQPGFGAVAGPNITFPVVFHDGATLAGGKLTINSGREITLNNCGTKVFTPTQLSPSFSSEGSSRVATSVTVSGLELGDVAFASFNPASATSSLDTLGLSLSVVHVGSGSAVVEFANNGQTTSSAVTASGTIRVCYFD